MGRTRACGSQGLPPPQQSSRLHRAIGKNAVSSRNCCARRGPEMTSPDQVRNNRKTNLPSTTAPTSREHAKASAFGCAHTLSACEHSVESCRHSRLSATSQTAAQHSSTPWGNLSMSIHRSCCRIQSLGQSLFAGSKESGECTRLPQQQAGKGLPMLIQRAPLVLR